MNIRYFYNNEKIFLKGLSQEFKDGLTLENLLMWFTVLTVYNSITTGLGEQFDVGRMEMSRGISRIFEWVTWSLGSTIDGRERKMGLVSNKMNLCASM